MNRIAGILNFDRSPVEPDALDRMIRAMKLQKGDGQAIWIEEGIGLACTRIGNTSSAQQEASLYRRPNEQWVMVFDGRIDNWQELSAVLKSEMAGISMPVSDGDLVLASYAKWGQNCIEHLVGDFAFAIWDRRKQSLLCARDRFGVKPFYYSISSRSFVFASTPRALLASRTVPPGVDEARIADFLVNPLEGIDKTSSFYEGMSRLEPAHLLTVRHEGLTLQPYWKLNPEVHPEFKTDGDYVEAFRELFAEAVRCRLRDASSSASMLSGGMDSSAIVGMGSRILAEEGRAPLVTFAAVSDSPDVNRETAHIQLVLGQDGFLSHLISETELRGRMDELVKVIEAEAEPFDCLMNLNRLVCLHAQDQGVRALLDGIDGDTLLSGSGNLPQLWRRGAFRTVINETLKAEGLIGEYMSGRSLFFSSLISAITPTAPGWYRDLRRPIRYRRRVAAAVKESIIHPDFAARVNLGERFARLDSHSPRPRSNSQVESHKNSLNHTFLTVGLERYERVASAFGIEARHPFTDVRLAEFCLGLPWQLKTRGGWTKFILRKALEPYLPAQVIWRTDKDSLMWEFNRVILKERAEYFHQLTLDESKTLESYVDMNKLAKFWQEYLRFGDEKHAGLIWSGTALAMWLRQQSKLKSSRS